MTLTAPPTHLLEPDLSKSGDSGFFLNLPIQWNFIESVRIVLDGENRKAGEDTQKQIERWIELSSKPADM